MVTNTAERNAHPEWLMGGNPRAIEAQEARGQKELTESQQLPVEINTGKLETLVKAGVKIGNAVEGDPLFRQVGLPEGWKIVATEHSMWSELKDEKGEVRAHIFYKAAFYDRRAHMDIVEPSKN